jgi:hypothetical protein
MGNTYSVAIIGLSLLCALQALAGSTGNCTAGNGLPQFKSLSLYLSLLKT